mmetsp:Transcript_12818/g.20995  ORF Transcript_12818/g.20995 Transcript_12818/m.20995 type:complete len:91 (+) Transcript_12818:153-425(+)
MATGNVTFQEESKDEIDRDLFLSLSKTNEEDQKSGLLMCNDDDQSKGFLFCCDTNDVCAEGFMNFFKREASSTVSVQGDSATSCVTSTNK